MLKDIIGHKTVYIVTGYTDMRKGIDGLAAIVQGKLQLDLLWSIIFVTFVAKKNHWIVA